jgi:primosomal protein N' (replication factor Y)
MFANVVVDLEGRGLPGPLTYAIPEAMRPLVRIGTYVQVPLGTRQALGYVVELQGEFEGTAKPLAAVLYSEPLFDPPLLRLATWMAHRYRAPLAETLRCIVPEGIATRLRTRVALEGVTDPEDAARTLERRSPALASLLRILAQEGAIDTRTLRERWKGSNLTSALGRLRTRGWIRQEMELESPPARPREVTVFRPAVGADVLAAEAEARRRRAPAQALALALFQESGERGFTAAELARRGTSRSVLQALARDGVLVAERVSQRRNPWSGRATATAPPPLTPDQSAAAAAIAETIHAGQHDTILLHGVTASGKTEVYLRAIETALSANKGAIVLLPEIALTAQVVEVFKSRLGERVALLHSRLSAGERYDEWQRLRTGEAQVAVGPRSALFAPTPNLGLVILDEEHEPSYKQENSPRYHARYAAIQRARDADAVLVLGSATPSVESYYHARNEDYRLVRMPERIPGRAMPSVRVVDMREHPPLGPQGVFSDELLDALARCIRDGEQAVLFLNRRGFASFILCRDCGYTSRCPHCSVSLTLHASDASLRCHHCNHQRPAPSLCPVCKGERVLPFGLGTERVEEAVRVHLPQARVLRMDRDTTGGKNAHARFYRAFRAGEAEILIGTQMVAKGLDFPGVTLVGVISADAGLNVPDFRAAERTFQLLTQVAGRAGRGERAGEVIIQTYNPEHYAVMAACKQDYEGFYAQEIQFRRELGYPPFGVLAVVLSIDPDSAVAEGRAGRAGASIARVARRHGWPVEVLGPAPAPLARIKQRYRWQLIVRGPDDEQVHSAIREGMALLPAADQDALIVDVDPMTMV